MIFGRAVMVISSPGVRSPWLIESLGKFKKVGRFSEYLNFTYLDINQQSKHFVNRNRSRLVTILQNQEIALIRTTYLLT